MVDNIAIDRDCCLGKNRNDIGVSTLLMLVCRYLSSRPCGVIMPRNLPLAVIRIRVIATNYKR
jgi:hypothetical protein